MVKKDQWYFRSAFAVMILESLVMLIYYYPKHFLVRLAMFYHHPQISPTLMLMINCHLGNPPPTSLHLALTVGQQKSQLYHSPYPKEVRRHHFSLTVGGQSPFNQFWDLVLPVKEEESPRKLPRRYLIAAASLQQVKPIGALRQQFLPM